MKRQTPDLTGRGFTLIEVTIAMTLVVFIAMILYGAFYIGQKAVERGRERTESSQRLRSIGEIFAGYIRSAYPYRSSPQNPSILFSGEQTSLSFVSALSSGLGGRGLAEITISWEGEGDGEGKLTLEEQMPVRPEGQESGGYKNTVVLGEHVRAFRIEYLDPQSEDQPWVDQWDGTEKRILPRAIRLTQRGEKGQEVQRVFPIMMSVLAP